MSDTAIQPFPLEHLWAIGPQILLSVWGLLALLIDSAFLRGRTSAQRRQTLGVFSLLGVFAVVAYLMAPMPTHSEIATDSSLFYGTLAGDMLTSSFNGLLAVLLGLVIALSMAWDFTEDWGAYFALLFWATVGMMFLIAAEELLILFLALEFMTICLYLASAFEKQRRRSPEAGLKYFVYGSVSSAMFLFGLSLIYGLTGTTYLHGIQAALVAGPTPGLGGNLAGAMALMLVLVGFGFKVAAVPFHQWAPDAYEGAPAPVSAWIATGSKIASFIALMKVLVFALSPWAVGVDALTGPGWVMIVAVLAALTMTFCNFAALAQRNLKRLLAYSSIAHAGYILVGVLAAMVTIRANPSESAASVLFYLVIYGFTTIGAFAVAAWLARDRGGDDIEDLNGLGYESPILAACIVILMLSLIGMPPLAGFFAKLYIFMEVVNTQDSARNVMLTLVALALANSVVSAFYYVRVLKAMFLRRAERKMPAAPRMIAWPIGLTTLVVIGFGLAPSPLLESMRGAAGTMLTINPPFVYTPGEVIEETFLERYGIDEEAQSLQLNPTAGADDRPRGTSAGDGLAEARR
ncbi:NADH-quinone oxidoreductase subunit N [soil metagenome]